MKKLKRNFRHAFLMASLLATVGCEKENLESDENSSNLNISNERTASLTFNKSKDILIAQFDGKPDADDIHSVAALGCMLNHSDLSGVNYFAVQGAYGNQSGTFIQAKTLYNKVFGAENTKWTDANANKTASVNKVHGIVKNILQSGGKVWVQEAGQSSFTKLWVAKLIVDGISESLIKSNVIVVQHSKWNEDHTNASDLTYVKQKTTYQPIDDGNQDSGTGPNRGPNTPNYKSSSTSFLNNAINSQNAKAKDFWKTAKDIISASGFNASYSTIPGGGVDFSDCVENFWIFETTNASSVTNFWNRYVTNSTTTSPCTGVVNPVVSIVSPANNTNYNQGQNVTITSSATSAVAITKVEFYDGTSLVGTDTSAPYNFSSSSLNVGSHSFTAKAYSDCNKTATSTAITIKINGVVTPPPTSGPVSGPSCGRPLQSLTYELSPQQRANATSYNWFFRGAKQSLTVNSNGYSATVVPTRGNGEICVGVRYSTGTSYVEYCKTITVCTN